jgi:hypothetical protein
MGFWVPAMAMMAAGMAKNELIDKPEARAMQKKNADIAAAQTEFSPLTGAGQGTFKAQQDPSTIGAGMKWGMAGAQMGQGLSGGDAGAGAQDTRMAENYQPNSNPYEDAMQTLSTGPTDRWDPSKKKRPNQGMNYNNLA